MLLPPPDLYVIFSIKTASIFDSNNGVKCPYFTPFWKTLNNSKILPFISPNFVRIDEFPARKICLKTTRMKQKSKPGQSIRDCLKQSMETILCQVGGLLISFLKAYPLKTKI